MLMCLMAGDVFTLVNLVKLVSDRFLQCEVITSPFTIDQYFGRDTFSLCKSYFSSKLCPIILASISVSCLQKLLQYFSNDDSIFPFFLLWLSVGIYCEKELSHSLIYLWDELFSNWSWRNMKKWIRDVHVVADLPLWHRHWEFRLWESWGCRAIVSKTLDKLNYLLIYTPNFRERCVGFLDVVILHLFVWSFV